MEGFSNATKKCYHTVDLIMDNAMDLMSSLFHSYQEICFLPTAAATICAPLTYLCPSLYPMVLIYG